jgi:hypothetical protein
MRGFRLLLVVLILSPIIVLALSESKLTRQPFAQVTAAPGPVVVPAPFAPGAPQAFSTIGALPSLAAAPGFTPRLAASVAPTPRVFRCTCGAPGTWTEWAGLVASSNFLLASQAARGQCATLLNQNAPSPYIVPEGTTASSAHQQIYNGTAFTQRAQVSTSVGQNVVLPRSSVTQLTTECSRCACN